MIQPKISVIVPVYNAEKYLHRCVDSILKQTFTDFEVLLINDGSTDQSPAICDEYAKTDSRVRVFHKENGGVSSARNVGLQNMRGEYSIHCDSDDFYHKDILLTLYNEASRSNADLIWCDFYVVKKDNNMLVSSQKLTGNSYDFIKGLLSKKLHGSMWNKLLRNSMIKDNALSFVDGIDMWEDLVFIIRYLLCTPKIVYLSRPLYYYVNNSESLCAQTEIKVKPILQKIVVVKYLKNLFLKEKLCFPELIYLSVYAKYGLISNTATFNPKIWRQELPINLSLLLSSKFPIKIRLFNFLAFFHLDILLLLLCYLKKIIKWMKS